MSWIIRRRSGLTVLVSLMESSFLSEVHDTSILRTGALHCYHYYTLSTGYRPLGSCPRAAGWSAATSRFDPSETLACRRDALPTTIRLMGRAIVAKLPAGNYGR